MSAPDASVESRFEGMTDRQLLREEQAIARAHRMGQVRTVQVHRLLAWQYE